MAVRRSSPQWYKPAGILRTKETALIYVAFGLAYVLISAIGPIGSFVSDRPGTNIANSQGQPLCRLRPRSPAGSTTNSQQGTPAGTYPVTLTASAAGATQSTANFNVIVTP